MRAAASVCAAALLLAPFPASAADDAALARCRAIRDTAARLACYDAIPIAPAPAAPAPAARPEPRASTPQPPAPAEFGLEQRANPAELKSIESHIPGRFEGWRPNMRIKLANGQVWQISDGSTRFASLDNPKVTIRRGALGSFFMDIEGEGTSPRVRRLE